MRAVPLHKRIQTDIEQRILSGALRPGDRLPSEFEFMADYGCSRMTVNKALSALSEAGLLLRRKRAGTIVARPGMESMALDVPDLPAEIARRGQVYGYRLVERLVRPASAEGHEALLARGGDLLLVRGVHAADDVPLAYEERLVSLAAVPEIADADLRNEPPGSWLLRHVPWTEAENRLGAAAAAPDMAALLGVPAGSACLTVERRTWRANEHITLVRQYFVAGRYELVARFGASRRPARTHR